MNKFLKNKLVVGMLIAWLSITTLGGIVTLYQYTNPPSSEDIQSAYIKVQRSIKWQDTINSQRRFWEVYGGQRVATEVPDDQIAVRLKSLYQESSMKGVKISYEIQREIARAFKGKLSSGVKYLVIDYDDDFLRSDFEEKQEMFTKLGLGAVLPESTSPPKIPTVLSGNDAIKQWLMVTAKSSAILLVVPGLSLLGIARKRLSFKLKNIAKVSQLGEVISKQLPHGEPTNVVDSKYVLGSHSWSK